MPQALDHQSQRRPWIWRDIPHQIHPRRRAVGSWQTVSEESTVSADSTAAEATASAAESADETAASGAGTSVDGATVSDGLEDVNTDAARGTSGGTGAIASSDSSAAASADSAAASELNGLPASGDFSGALEAFLESGAADSPDNVGIENLTDDESAEAGRHG